MMLKARKELSLSLSVLSLLETCAERSVRSHGGNEELLLVATTSRSSAERCEEYYYYY